MPIGSLSTKAACEASLQTFSKTSIPNIIAVDVKITKHKICWKPNTEKKKSSFPKSLNSCALLVDDHPVPLCGFSSPFLESSPPLVDHYAARLGSSYGIA
ncbi:hypothetical protein TNCV_4445381 [Trichonephila clavipes]|nr:hypothetical protein TNCV_4445381 [Trichonephila clavipes]